MADSAGRRGNRRSAAPPERGLQPRCCIAVQADPLHRKTVEALDIPLPHTVLYIEHSADLTVAKRPGGRFERVHSLAQVGHVGDPRSDVSGQHPDNAVRHFAALA